MVNIISGCACEDVSGRDLLSRPSKEIHFHRCGRAASNSLRTQIGQKRQLKGKFHFLEMGMSISSCSQIPELLVLRLSSSDWELHHGLS